MPWRARFHNTMKKTPLQRAVIDYIIDSNQRLVWKKYPFTPCRFIYKGERLGGKPLEEDVVAVFPTSKTFETIPLKKFAELYKIKVPNQPETQDSPQPEEKSPQKTIPIANDENLAERIMLDELSGRTNKSEDQLRLELERELAAAHPAPRLDPDNLPKESCSVEIPPKVINALRYINAVNDLPIDRLSTDWLEAMVAEHNGVPAEMIAADDCIIRTGKSWHYIAESAKAFTGFTFYPSEK